MTRPDPHRPPPHWLVIGAPKAGTTTLAGWLAEHPQLCLANTKEVRYWNIHYDRGRQWYLDQFSAWRPGLLAGEGTPSYLYSDRALDRIAEAVPDVRLLVILREHVDRLWSHYWFARSFGFERVSFDRALARDRRKPRMLPDGETPLGIRHTSIYAPRIRAVRERFPAEQLCVLFYDDLRERPEEFFRTATDHLGVEPMAPPADERPRNYGRVVRSAWFSWASWRPPIAWLPMRARRRIVQMNVRQGVSTPKIDPAVRAKLWAEFADDRRELAELLGRPLPPAWTKEPVAGSVSASRSTAQQ